MRYAFRLQVLLQQGHRQHSKLPYTAHKEQRNHAAIRNYERKSNEQVLLAGVRRQLYYDVVSHSELPNRARLSIPGRR